MASWQGFEYHRVRGPYEKKRRGHPSAWTINLYQDGVKKPKTITRSSRDLIDPLVEQLRAELGAEVPAKRGRPRGSLGPHRKSTPVPVPQATGDEEELDYDAELCALAVALRTATTAEQVDIVKRKADALKALRALQASAPKKKDEDPTADMSMPELLEAAAEHLRLHGYKVEHDDSTRNQAGQEVHKPVVQGGGKRPKK